MRNKFLLAASSLCALLCSFGLHAQQHRFEVGIVYGPNIAQYREDGASNTDYYSKTLAVAGASFQYNFSRAFSLHTGLNYEQKGSLEHYYGPSGGMETSIYDWRADYLTVPVLFRAYAGNRVRAFANAGVYAGYRLNASGLTLQERLDMGLAAGLGVSVPIIKKIAVNVEVRDNFGLRNTNFAADGNRYKHICNTVNFLFGMTYRFH